MEKHTPAGGATSFAVIMQNIEDISQDLFVREKLDDDRVWYWVERFQNAPESVHPIEITQDGSLTDGRHRIAAAELCDRTEIRAYIYPVKNKGEQIKRAFLSNVSPDSPKPPTKADAILTIKQMIGQHMKKNEIIDTMAKMFPVSTSKGLYDEARHAIYRDNLRDAKRSVLDDGNTIIVAATTFGIDPDKLREELGGKKKKKDVMTPGEFNRDLSSHYRSHGQKVRTIFTKVDKLYNDGELSKANVIEIYEYAIKSARQKLRDLTDKAKRFEA